MSLDSCNDVPISPLRALIAVHLTACTVYRKALFSSIYNLLMCFLLRYITSVPCRIAGNAALFQ